MLPRFRDQLLHTKFASPQLRASAVARQRLDSYLAAVDRAPVTLIAAPAGFGKTTLVAAWAAQASERVAWLSLDDADNDPARFWVYLLTALEVARPGVAAPALGHLFQAQLPPIETTLTRLINDIDALPERLTLVLDDYHCISASEIHRGIAFLMNHQPAQLGLILLARADPPLPLNRLRARGQLLELRADDLRFTADEAAAFLNDSLRLGLAAPDVAALEARTEGWVAGLQLASLALRGQPDASRFVSSFTGSNRYVLSYLIDEVLARQPEEVQAFLLCTSILDRLCAELCDHLLALAQPPVDSSQAMLDRLYTAQLFLAALDDHGQWYRYHTLFADMLRHRLKQARPELLPALHVRASQWYEQRRYFHEAMRHAIAAGASELVATLTETHGGELLLQGEHATLARWLGAIPHDQLRAHPRLVALYARNQFALAQLGDVAERLAEAEAQLRAAASAHADGWEPEQHQLLGQLLGLRAYATRLGGDLALSIAQSHEALILLPADDLLQRSFVLQNLGSSYRWAGDPRAAGQAYADAAQLAERSEARSGAIKPLCLQGEMLEERGLLRDAQQHYLHARRLADEPPRADAASPVTSWAYVVLGRLWYEWNDLKQARQLFQEGLARASLGGDEDVLWRGYQGLALAALANHDQPASQAWLAETERLLQHTDIPRNQAWAGAFRAMLALRSGAVLAASLEGALGSAVLDRRTGEFLACVGEDIEDEIAQSLLEVVAALGAGGEDVISVRGQTAFLACALEASNVLVVGFALERTNLALAQWSLRRLIEFRGAAPGGPREETHARNLQKENVL